MPRRNRSARRSGDIRMASRPPLVRDRSRTSGRRSAVHGWTIRAQRAVHRAAGPRSGVWSGGRLASTSSAVLRRSRSASARSAARASAARSGATTNARTNAIASTQAKAAPLSTRWSKNGCSVGATNRSEIPARIIVKPSSPQSTASPVTRAKTAPVSTAPRRQRARTRSRPARNAGSLVTAPEEAGFGARTVAPSAVMAAAIRSGAPESSSHGPHSFSLKLATVYFFVLSDGLAASICSTSSRSIVPSARSESMACPSEVAR